MTQEQNEDCFLEEGILDTDRDTNAGREKVIPHQG